MSADKYPSIFSRQIATMVYVKIDGDTELAQAVDVMMARAKRIYILTIKVNKLFSLFSSRRFLKEIDNMSSVFLSSYRNTRESLENSKKLWKHSPAARVPTAFVAPQTSTRVSIYIIR